MTTCPTDNLEVAAKAACAVTMNAVSKKYPIPNGQGSYSKDLFAIKGVSLEILQGEVTGVIGRNGAGKTTLLNLICGVLSPSSGKIMVKGKVLGLFNLGIGFQDELSGRENIFLNGALLGAPKKELREKFDSIVEFSELGDFIGMPLGAYSQGMRLRLAFSVIANLDFDILVIDEALAVGDALFQSKCYERLMDFRRAGKTLIITTQSMELIERFCDKAALLDHGSLLFYGNVSDAINRYHALLNTEKFYVGCAKINASLIENTKKWAHDITDWGKKLGTKEVVIDSVEFINRFGFRCKQVKSGDPLTVKVNFTAKDNIAEPHFGAAIFRNDGVYCYGPNTKFDAYYIPQIKRGRGWFSVSYRKMLLATGKYRFSIAIWDKNETLAFDYHNGCYGLAIKGENKLSALSNIPFKIGSNNSLTNQRLKPPFLLFKPKETLVNLDSLKDEWGKCVEAKEIKIESVKILNARNQEKSFFITNDPVKIIVKLSHFTNDNDSLYLWLGLYRDDKVYCQGLTRPLAKNNGLEVIFPALALLPGSYRVSLGIWDSAQSKFIAYRHGIYHFAMAFNRQDHGTVYLKHTWKWGYCKNA